MSGIRLIELGLTEAWRTQAVYHAVAESMTDSSPDTIIFCRPASPYLCLGYHQHMDDVFDREECCRRSLPVFTRKIGGGATLLDENQLFYQCVFHRSRTPLRTPDIFRVMLSAPVTVLRRLGLQASLHDVNEIRVGTKRIAGTGGGFVGEASVVVGNILLDFDFETMVGVWQRRNEHFPRIALRALQDHLTTLRRENVQASMADLQSSLKDEFARAFVRPTFAGSLTEEESKRSEELAVELSDHQEPSGNVGAACDNVRRPLKIAAGTFIHEETRPVDGQMISGIFLVHDGTIIEVSLHSEGEATLEREERCLVGSPFEGWTEAFREGVPAA